MNNNIKYNQVLQAYNKFWYDAEIEKINDESLKKAFNMIFPKKEDSLVELNAKSYLIMSTAESLFDPQDDKDFESLRQINDLLFR